MAIPQTIVVTTTTSQSNAVASTKVRVTANAAVHFNVGSNPVAATANCEIIGANQTRYINMQGLNNKLAFIAATGVAEVSVQQIGTVASSGIILGNTYIPS